MMRTNQHPLEKKKIPRAERFFFTQKIFLGRRGSREILGEEEMAPSNSGVVLFPFLFPFSYASPHPREWV